MGMLRELNEDNCMSCSIEIGNLFMVADGMGGHNAGEVASSIAVKCISEFICDRVSQNDSAVDEIIREAIVKANRDIYEESIKNSAYSGMGTTITVVVAEESMLHIGHVGDSRAYVLKDGKIHKITNDHSLVAELVKSGTITEDEAERHPQKNIITRALGIEDTVEVDIETAVINAGDIVILCSDGLSNMLHDEEMQQIVLESQDMESAARNLIDEANKRGGYDNITVVLAKHRDEEVRG